MMTNGFTTTSFARGNRRRTIETFGDEMIRLDDHGEEEQEENDSTSVDDCADILRPEWEFNGN